MGEISDSGFLISDFSFLQSAIYIPQSEILHKSAIRLPQSEILHKLPEIIEMEKKYFSLSPVDNNKLVKIIQVVFGISCIGIAVYWVIFNISSLKTASTLWITILFLSGFGFYMIWAGLGKALRFFEIGKSSLRIKQTIMLPAKEILAGEIKKIELFPFKLIFLLNTDKKFTMRLSSSYYETNENIKDAVIIFAEENSIDLEEMEEKI
jgi:hypothetical protein